MVSRSHVIQRQRRSKDLFRLATRHKRALLVEEMYGTDGSDAHSGIRTARDDFWLLQQCQQAHMYSNAFLTTWTVAGAVQYCRYCLWRSDDWIFGFRTCLQLNPTERKFFRSFLYFCGVLSLSCSVASLQKF